VGAKLLDSLILGVLSLLCFVPAFVLLATGDTELEPCFVDAEGDVVDTLEVEDLIDQGVLENNALCDEPTGATVAIALAAGAVGLVPCVLLSVWWYRRLGRTGQTPGRSAAGIRVVDAGTGLPIGAGRAFGREIVGNMFAYALGLGFLWVIWDKRKQGWHDKVITTVVVRDP
jgi:hypothetical protein